MIMPSRSMNFEVSIPLFPSHVEVCFCRHDEILGFAPPEDAEGAYNYKLSKLWINTEHKHCDSHLLGVMAHECVHAAFGIVSEFASGEMPGDMVGEECISYLTEYIFKDIIDHLIGDK